MCVCTSIAVGVCVCVRAPRHALWCRCVHALGGNKMVDVLFVWHT